MLRSAFGNSGLLFPLCYDVYFLTIICSHRRSVPIHYGWLAFRCVSNYLVDMIFLLSVITSDWSMTDLLINSLFVVTRVRRRISYAYVFKNVVTQQLPARRVAFVRLFAFWRTLIVSNLTSCKERGLSTDSDLTPFPVTQFKTKKL